MIITETTFKRTMLTCVVIDRFTSRALGLEISPEAKEEIELCAYCACMGKGGNDELAYRDFIRLINSSNKLNIVA